MILPPPPTKFETDPAGRIIYPVDNGEPLSNDTEHLDWINFVKDGLDDWFADREDVFVAADLLWYPVEGRPDICKAPDVMVALGRPDGPRSCYQQWEEDGQPPQVVFEFISRSNTADEMMDKLDFYSAMGCEEFFIYDYRRGKLHLFRRDGGPGLAQSQANDDGAFESKVLGMSFGLDSNGALWVRRPDGRAFETRRELLRRADHEARRAEEEAKRAEEEAKRAAVLAAKLKELGIDPDSL